MAPGYYNNFNPDSSAFFPIDGIETLQFVSLLCMLLAGPDYGVSGQR